MTDDALEAFRANDRPHSLEADGYERIERIMLDAYQDAEPAAASDVTTIPVGGPDASGSRPTRRGRAIWVAVAAGFVLLGLGAAQLAGNPAESAPAGSQVLGDYCQDYLDPVADALDLLRTDPNQANATETYRLLDRALIELEESTQIAIETGDLAEEHRKLQPSPTTSDSLIEIAHTLGQRAASLTESSPLCDYQRLAPNQDRKTDLLGRPTSGD